MNTFALALLPLCLLMLAVGVRFSGWTWSNALTGVSFVFDVGYLVTRSPWTLAGAFLAFGLACFLDGRDDDPPTFFRRVRQRASHALRALAPDQTAVA